MKLICIDDKDQYPQQLLDPVEEGEVYTVKRSGTCSCGCNTKVYIINEAGNIPGYKIGFEQWRFEEYTQSVEEITEFLENEILVL